MEPDITKYTDQMESLCAAARQQNMKLRPEQVREVFEGLELDPATLLAVLHELNNRGIHLETMITPENGQEEQNHSGGRVSSGTAAQLTEQDREYLEEYIAGLHSSGEEEQASLLPYLEKAARIAAEMNCAELPLADLIQEANIAVLTMPENEETGRKDPAFFDETVREALNSAIRNARNEKNGDELLVEKVAQFEKSVREINETGEQFSMAELAVLLDLDIEEIKAILRLTGDYE